MEEFSDEEIINLLGSTNTKEVDKGISYLYRVSKKMAGRFIMRNRGNPQDVDDIFHDGLIAFYKLVRKGQIKADTNVEAYLYTICRNMWVKKLMKNPAPVELKEKFPLVETADIQITTLLKGERKTLMDKILKDLGAECEKILFLFYYDRKKTKEIAALLNYSNDQVLRNKKSRCMNALREMVLNSAFYKEQLLNR